MDGFELPEDLVDFLRHGKELEYEISEAEPGEVKLVAYGQHKLGEVWVDSENHPYAYSDPHCGEKGYYAIPTIGLIAECEHFDPPDYILLWLPQWNMYGSWDDDHWDLHIFPGASWTDIAANPLPFINAQWKRGKVRSELFVPWLSSQYEYEFKQGRPF